MAKRKNDQQAKPSKKKPVTPPPQPVDVPDFSLDAPMPADLFDEPAATREPVSDVVKGQRITGLDADEGPISEPISGVIKGQRITGLEVAAEPASDIVKAQRITGLDLPESGGRKSELVLGDEGARRKSEVVLGEPISAVDYGPESPPKKKRVSEVVLGEPISGLSEQDWSKAPSRRRTSEVDLGEQPQPISDISRAHLAPEEGLELLESKSGSDEYPRGTDSGVALPEIKKKGKPAAAKKAADATVAFDGADEVSEADLTEAMDVVEGEDAEDALEAEEAEEVEFDDLVEDKKTRPGSKRQEAKEAEAEFGFAEDVTKEVAEDASELLEAEETTDGFAMQDDEEDGRKKNKKKKRWDEGESGEFASPRQQPYVAPKYGRRWFGGMVLGLLLGAGAVAAVWYLKPELLGDVLAMSPNHKKDPVAVAMQSMLTEDYDGAVAQLKDSGDHKLVSLRGEARLQKYMKNIASKGEPNPADPELKAAIDDINASQDAYRKANVQRILDEKNNKALAALVDNLKKATGKAALNEIEAFVVASVDAGKTAEEVKVALVDAGQIAKKEDFKIDEFKVFLKDATGRKADFDQINKSLKDNGIADAGLKGVETLAALKKDIEGKMDAVDKLLADQKIDKKGAPGVQELVVARDALKTDRDDLDKVVKDTFKVLEDGKIVPPAADPRKELVNATQIARLKAESPLAIPLTQLGSSLSKLGGDAGDALVKMYERTGANAKLALLLSREPFVQAPEQRLDSLVALLWNRDLKKDALIDDAGKTAGWILDKNAAAKPDALGKAHLVVGLAARNQGKYEEARQSLAQAVVELNKDAGAAEWGRLAQIAHAELTNPAVYYMPRIKELFDRGLKEADLELIPQARQSFKLALAEAAAALEALQNNPQILAQRGLVAVHDARTQGRAAVAAIAAAVRQDAAAAIADDSAKAQGNYLMGVLEEMLGNGDVAERHFRAAVDLAPEVEKGRYRLALARLLQQNRPANNPFPDELKPAEPKVGQGRPPAPVRTSYLHPLANTMAALLLGQAGATDDEDDPIQAKRMLESIEIAQKMIQSANRDERGNGHLLLGKAYSKLGRKSEALREYAKGVKILHGTVGTELMDLLDNHPAFQIPDAFNKPNPYMAEQFYGKGLHYFWAQRYAEAEQQFNRAVAYYGQDARYQYFLGLSLLAQGGKLRRDNAAYAIEQGARLEASNRPSSTEVNAALERLQGEMRQLLNAYRTRALNAIN